MKASRKTIERVKTRWLELWNEKLADGGSAHAEMWFQAVTDVLIQDGYDIVPASVRLDEAAISANGMEDEYMDALVSVTRASLNNQMALATATAEQRAKAVAVVRAHDLATSHVKTKEDN